MKQIVYFEDLGQMDYQSAWDYQEQLMKANLDIKINNRLMQLTRPANDWVNEKEIQFTSNHLLFVEHPPVYTLGKSGKKEHILIGEDDRVTKGIQFFNTNRGGDITFHGPQQIVGYPILDLENFFTDIGLYLRTLEEMIIMTLAEYGIEAGRSAGETGVWLDAGIPGKERKICALGVRCSRWITMHGFAFNVNTDLSYFNHIIPCGIQGKQVTSLQKELGWELNLAEVKQKVKKNFAICFDAELREN